MTPACSIVRRESQTTPEESVARLRTVEIYDLTCHACQHPVMVPVAVVAENVGNCPQCGTRLEIRWKVTDAAA